MCLCLRENFSYFHQISPLSLASVSSHLCSDADSFRGHTWSGQPGWPFSTNFQHAGNCRGLKYFKEPRRIDVSEIWPTFSFFLINTAARINFATNENLHSNRRLTVSYWEVIPYVTKPQRQDVVLHRWYLELSDWLSAAYLNTRWMRILLPQVYL